MASLRNQYDAIRETAAKFCEKLREVVQALLSDNGVSLGVPLESRVKSWESIIEKTARLSLKPKDISQLNDLVGLRVILLFRRDVTKVCSLLSDCFSVVSREDASVRLAEAEFGYQSLHYIIKLPEGWLSVPVYREFRDLKAEIQVRTLAQHIWAAGSHILQYKHEAGVPIPVRRSIYRVSALLETVDLEFERVLAERESYISRLRELPATDLNVDLLARILDQRLPQEDKMESEPYSELLDDLRHFHLNNSRDLSELISKHCDAALDTSRQHTASDPGRGRSQASRPDTADSPLAAIKSLLFERGKKFVGSCVEHIRDWRFENGKVTFIYSSADSGRVWADLLGGRESKEALRAACAEVFGQPVEVQVVVQDVGESPSRAARGHVGLVRAMLAAEFGERWRTYRHSR
jgi:GTP pyrophosphokinase